jgi:serine/threonine protein kinase
MKPANILLTTAGGVKITDFGSSKGDAMSETFVGTTRYRVPAAKLPNPNSSKLSSPIRTRQSFPPQSELFVGLHERARGTPLVVCLMSHTGNVTCAQPVGLPAILRTPCQPGATVDRFAGRPGPVAATTRTGTASTAARGWHQSTRRIPTEAQRIPRQ